MLRVPGVRAGGEGDGVRVEVANWHHGFETAYDAVAGTITITLFGLERLNALEGENEHLRAEHQRLAQRLDDVVPMLYEAVGLDAPREAEDKA